MDLQLIAFVFILIIFYTICLWFCFSFIREGVYNETVDYYKQLQYKREMQNAQNTAKQYKKTLKEKKTAYKTLQRRYSCIEQENKCLKAKLCEDGDVE